MGAKGLTSEIIVAEAVKCIEENGQPVVSLHEIARRLGVKTPSLYNHIKNTKELQYEICQYAIDKFVSNQLSATKDKIKDEAVKAFAEAYHSFAIANKGLYRLIMSIPSEDDDRVKRYGSTVIVHGCYYSFGLQSDRRNNCPLAACFSCYTSWLYFRRGVGLFLFLQYDRSEEKP